MSSAPWLALIIGNTRLHWGLFEQEALKGVWHTAHLTPDAARQLQANGFRADSWRAVLSDQDLGDGDWSDEDAHKNAHQDNAVALPKQAIALSSLWVASVVPEQAALWGSTNFSANFVVRSRISLSNLYPTLGIDRAINVLGAGKTLGWPVLVIDGGTALTFTAGVKKAEGNAIYGGAILPGVSLQHQALAQQSTALAEAICSKQPSSKRPSKERPPKKLPERWAMDTAGAIASGVLYGAAAVIADYITDWWQQFPAGHVVLTGGDGPMLYALLQQKTPAIAAGVQVDSYLMFWGMQTYCSATARAEYY